jgi:hypothetical protein
MIYSIKSFITQITLSAHNTVILSPKEWESTGVKGDPELYMDFRIESLPDMGMPDLLDHTFRFVLAEGKEKKK